MRGELGEYKWRCSFYGDYADLDKPYTCYVYFNNNFIKIIRYCKSTEEGENKAVAFIKEHKRELKLMSLGI